MSLKYINVTKVQWCHYQKSDVTISSSMSLSSHLCTVMSLSVQWCQYQYSDVTIITAMSYGVLLGVHLLDTVQTVSIGDSRHGELECLGIVRVPSRDIDDLKKKIKLLIHLHQLINRTRIQNRKQIYNIFIIHLTTNKLGSVLVWGGPWAKAELRLPLIAGIKLG